MILFLYLLYWLMVLVLILTSLYLISCLVGEVLGAPFVPSPIKDLLDDLKKLKLKPGMKIYDLGSGDGRVLRYAVKKYGVSGLGVEINPLLVFYSGLISKLQGLKNIRFEIGNLLNADLKKADLVILFLMPPIVKKLAPKLKAELKPGTLILSRAFQIPGFERYLVNKTARKHYSSYFYQIS